MLLGAGALPGEDNVTSALALYRQAQEHFAKRDLEKARSAAAEALRVHERLPEAENLLGIIGQAEGNVALAERHFRKALQLSPEFVEARKNLGALYFQQRRFSPATREFTEVLELQSNDFMAHHGLGLLALLGNNPTQALVHFAAARRVRPQEIPTLLGLLDAQLLLAREAAAEKTLAELNSLVDPKDPRRMEFPTLLALRGNYRLAIREYERIRAEVPDSYDLDYNLVLAYHRAGNHTRAAEILKVLIARRPEAELRNLLANVEEAQGNHSEAVEAFRQAVEREPTNEDYVFDYGYDLLRHGAWETALSVFDGATLYFDRSPRMKLGLGVVYYLQGKFEPAIQAFLEATEIDMSSPTAYFFLGKATIAATTYTSQVTERFRTYLASDPKDPMAHYLYARILLKPVQASVKPDYLLARRHLEKGLALDPALAEAHLELGNINVAEGNFEEAVADYRRAVAADPRLSTPHYRLALVYRRLGETERAGKEMKLFQSLKSLEEKAREQDDVVGRLGESGQ